MDVEQLYLQALGNPVLTFAPPPDLTGANSTYYHSHDRYAAYVTGQPIIFDQTLFQQGLILTPEGGSSPWVFGTDWTVMPDDIDNELMAKATAMLPGFSLTLVKSITILHAQTDLPVFFNLASQSFYPRPENMPPLPDAQNALTALLENIVARLATIETEVTRVTITTSGSSITPKLLAWDINGTNPDNLIEDELYTVNTYSGQSTIHPVNGSFFRDSLVLTAGGQPLVAGTDYRATNLNSAKTTLTANRSGVYDSILLSYDYAGPVQVTYHAVGGEATVSDVSAIYQSLLGIQNFLNQTGFLTTDSLSTNQAFQTLLNKTIALENQMRALLSGPPTYGDSANGVAVKKFLRAADAGLHFWTIASLYKVDGSTDIIKKDRIKLRLEMVNALLMADVSIAFDLENLRDPLTVNAANIIQDVQFTPYGTLGTLANVVIPQFRVVWDQPSTYTSGAFLQIGLNLPTTTETIAIEDRSGIESCWMLDTTTGTASVPLTPNDNNFTLPDGASVWSSGNSSSLVAIDTMPNESGYLLWNGAQSLKTIDSTVGRVTLTNSLPSWFRIQDISEIVAEFQDAASNPMRVLFPMTGVSATVRRGIGMLYLGADGVAPVPMEVALTLAAGAITLQVEVHTNVQAQPVTNLRYLIAKLSNSAI